MRVISILLAALCLFLLLIVIAGAMLPKRHVISMRATYSQSPEHLFALIVGSQSWRPDVTHEELINVRDGETLSRETDRRGKTVTYEVHSIEPSRKFSRTIASKDLPYGGTWTGSLQPIGTGTVLTITEEGEIYNPVFRLLLRFVFGYTSTISAYMISLGRTAGEAVKPTVVPQA